MAQFFSMLFAAFAFIALIAPTLAVKPSNNPRLRHRDLSDTDVVSQSSKSSVISSSFDRPAPTGDIYVHDPSGVVFDNVSSLYYAFGTGLLRNEILASHVSKDGYAWEQNAPVFKKKPDWVAEYVPANKGVAFWAPDVSLIDGLWHLYYAVSSFGSQISCIGLVTTKSLDPHNSDYQWNDHGPVICSSTKTLFNTIDPHVFTDPATGKVWMNYGSYWKGIFVVQLTQSSTGVYNVTVGDPVNVATNTRPLDAPSLESSWVEPSPLNDGALWIFANWGFCCRGVNSTYQVVVGVSHNGPTGPFIDQSGVDMIKGGGTLLLSTEGRQIGPGQIGFPFGGTDGGNGGTNPNGPNANRTAPIISYHYYDLNGSPPGQHTLGQSQIVWGTGKNYWPVAIDRE